MSVGRIGARVAAVGLGGLASIALIAAPSWAAHGTGANAKLCGTYPGALFARDGSTFKNRGACAKYARKGGQLVGIDAVAEPAVAGSFAETCTGFGLEPSTTTLILEMGCGATYSNGDGMRESGPQGADGIASVSANIPCTLAGGKVVSLLVLAFDPEGSVVEAEFPPPSGC